MIELIKYELKKHFIKLPIVSILIIFGFINIYKINGVFQDKGLFSTKYLHEYKDEYWASFQDFGGEITDEKIKKLMEIYNKTLKKISDRTLNTGYDENSYTYNAYSDEIFFRWFFIDEMKYDYFYKSYANSIITNAYSNVEFYNSINNTYKVRENSEIINLFRGREVTHFNYTEKYLHYLQYDFSTLLILLLCIYAVSRVFIYEKEIEMDKLLITTQKGYQTVTAKITASFLFIIVVTILFGILDYISFSVFFDNFGSKNSPLYSLANFKNTRLNIGLFTFSMLSLLVKTFGILIMSTFFLLCSCIFSKILYCYLSCFIAMIGLILLQDTKTNFIMGLYGRMINPMSLIKNRELFYEVSFVNILNYPFYKDVVIMIIGLGWIILLISLIYVFSTKNVLVKDNWWRNKYATSNNRVKKNND